MIHQRTHPTLDVPGCDPCRWSSVNLAGWTTSPEQRKQYFRLWKDEQEINRTKQLQAEGIVPAGTTTPKLDEAEHLSRLLDKPWNAGAPEFPELVS